MKTKLLLMLVLTGTTLFAQTSPFTTTNCWLSDNKLTVVFSGDFYNNGLKDVIAYGTDGVLHLYKNEGNGTFTVDNNLTFSSLYNYTLNCADLNNDGRLDILMTGNAGTATNPSYQTYIYINNGNGSFSEDDTTHVPGLVYAYISFVDYNNDGKTDFLLSGQNAQSVVSTTLYKNNGNFSFSAIPANFTGVRYGSSSWGDYNNDGFEDLLLTGQHVAADGTMTPIAEVYKNNGDGTFTLQSNISLSGISEGVGKWGDYDNDGDLDILIAGDDNDAGVYKIYNNTDGVFTEAQSFNFSKYNTAQWEDFNNDGYLDLFYAGQTWDTADGKWLPEAALMMYSGSDNTYHQVDLKLDTLVANNVISRIVSVDTSGNLDIYVSGDDSTGQQQAMLLLNTADTNNRPTAPKYLTAKQNNREMILNWDSATDVETNAKSLTYDLRIGTKPGGDDIFSPGSDSATDSRLKFAPGRVRKVDSGYVVNIPPGKYYWSIQAVDGGYKTSPFATEDSLEVDSAYFIPGAPVNLATKTISEHILNLSWAYQYNDAKSFIIERSDSTEDNFDSITTVNGTTFSYQDDSLVPDTKYYYRIKTSNGDTVSAYSDTIVGATWPIPLLSKIMSGTIVNEDYSSTSAAWGDYNNDGYLDLAVTNSNYPTEIFTNNGDGTFTKMELGTTGDATGVTWVDVNNDGYLDLFITQGQGYHNLLYINNGDGTFTKDTATALTQSTEGSSAAAWADYNKDGLVDVYICGLDSTDRLYENLGHGQFRVVKLPGDSVMNNSVGCDWIDYNDDGNIDLFVANYEKPNFLYKNNGDGTFTLIKTGAIVTDTDASVSGAWGDFNNDGYPDLFVAVNANGDNDFYVNNGDGTFSKDTIWPFANRGAGYTGGDGASWQDVNNDGNLDLFIAGNDGNQLYINNGDSTFTKKTDEPYCYDYGYSVAAVWGDYNNDGNMDLFIPNDYNQPNLLYRNNGYPPHESSLRAQPLENNRVMIRLKGVKSNSFGLGAKVVIKSGGRTFDRIITTQSGAFSSVNGLIASVGIGQNTDPTATIYWPSGIIQDVSSLKLNTLNVITEGVNTGVPSIQNVKMGIKIFPNPAKSYLYIKLNNDIKNGKITIDDVFGKTVKELSFDNLDGKNNIMLNIGDLKDGVYLLNVQSDQGYVTNEFVKE